MPRSVAAHSSRVLRPFRPLLGRISRSSAGRSIRQSAWLPNHWIPSVRLFRILALEYGHLRSVATGRSIDGNGEPVPWYTYPAIEYIRQLDVSNLSIFEYGSGFSTLFWGSAARQVTSVEDEEGWHAEMMQRLPPNCTLHLRTDLDAFVAAIHGLGLFDIIVVDGPVRGQTRLKCARAAVEHLREGGLIILDNSDWLPRSAAFLRDAGLLQVDMTGFGPINDFTSTTSFFFHRSCRIPPRFTRQPMYGTGARHNDWEPPRRGVGRQVRFGDGLFEDVAYEETFRVRIGQQLQTFRIIGYHPGAEKAAIAILHEEAGRVVLSNHFPVASRWPGPSNQLEKEAARLEGLAAPDFIAFINGHDQRRYTL
jgi:hypothetical protein